MTLVPRKRCSACGARYEGAGVAEMFSCDQCGNGYLVVLKPLDTEATQGENLPRGGGGGSVTHTRDGF